MAKRLWTTSALAVVVMMLVVACGSSSTSPSASRVRAAAAPRAAAPADRPRRAIAGRSAVRGRAGASRADGPDRLHRAGPGTWRRQAVQRQEGLDPDPVDRRRGHELRRRARRLRGRDRHQDPGRQHRLEPRDRAEDPHRGRQPAGPGDARPADARPGLRRRTARSSTSPRSWTPRSSAMSIRRPSAWSPRGRPHLGHPLQGRRQVDHLVPDQGLRGQGLHGSQDVGRADRPVRQDRRRRHQPVVRQRRRPRHGDRLAAHRLGRGSGPQDQGPQVYYNDWISHKITFQDPGIKDAFDKVGKIFFKDKLRLRRQHGDRHADQKTSMDPMFTDDLAEPEVLDAEDPRPGTARTSSRISGPAAALEVRDRRRRHRDLPVPDDRPGPERAEGSADTLMVLVDRPEVRAVAEFLATPEGLQGWIETGSAISTNTTTPGRLVRRRYKLKVAAEIANRRDGHRLRRFRPHARQVGRPGTFWTSSLGLGQQRRHQYRCRSEGHRRQLARSVTI